MNQSTSSSVEFQMIFGAIGFIVLGAPIGAANLVIMASILKYKVLIRRKELVILMALAGADGANLLAYVAAGVYRLVVVALNQQHELVSSSQCIIQPHIILWSFTIPISNLMLVAVSVDRLLLVSLRHKYIIALGRGYAWGVVSAIFGLSISFAMGALMVVILWGDSTPTLHALCHSRPSYGSSSPVSALFQSWYEGCQSLLPLLSVIIFALIAPIYKWNGVTPGLGQAAAMEKQRKLTKNVACSCLCTLFLACIPSRVAWVMFDREWQVAAYVLWMIPLTNPLGNVIIFHFGHRHIRKAVHGFLRCKVLPDNIDLW